MLKSIAFLNKIWYFLIEVLKMYRTFEKKLEKWDANKTKPLIVLGVRQCGKTYILKQFFNKKYKKFTYINLFNDDRIIEICKNEGLYDRRKVLISSTYNINFEDKDTLLFVDEVQLCPKFIQDLKSFCEDNITNIVVAGSLLSNRLKNMNDSFPVGKVHTEYLYPMNFEEYLYAINKQNYIPMIKECFINDSPFALHETLMKLYYDYLYIGGMPEMLQNYIDNDCDISKINEDILQDIKNDYATDITKHVEEDKDKLRIRRIYENIPSQLMKENPKFTYASIDGNNRKKDYVSSLDWLVTSNMVLQCNQLKNIEYPINLFIDFDNYKLFLSDVGLLRKTVNANSYDVLMSKDYTSKGIMTENYVACELQKQFNELNYWTRKNDGNGSKAEVDFVIQIKNEIIPIEVKSGNNKSQSLRIYNEKFKPNLMIKIANANFGKNNNIKTIPLYATFLIRDCLEEIYK